MEPCLKWNSLHTYNTSMTLKAQFNILVRCIKRTMAPIALMPDYFHTWHQFIASPSPRLQPIKSVPWVPWVPWCLRILVWPNRSSFIFVLQHLLILSECGASRRFSDISNVLWFLSHNLLLLSSDTAYQVQGCSVVTEVTDPTFLPSACCVCNNRMGSALK